MSAGPPVLLERQGELRALEALVDDAVAGLGGGAVVEGAAGIGKTTLARALADGARARGVRLLAARAAELERGFPFGVVRQLLEPALLAAGPEDRAALLQGPAARAAAVLDLQPASASSGETEPWAAAHGLFWLVANLSGAGALLVVVDDVQWADDPSLRLLAYLARRLDGLPVALVATLRTGEPVPAGVDALLAEPALARVRPGALGAAAVARLVGTALGAPPEPSFAEACRARTAGNPFLLTELCTELAARGVSPVDAAVAEVAEVVPERVAGAARRRLDALGPAPRALAEALVVLGDGTELELAAALARLGAEEAAGAAARLADADLVEPGAPLRFRHPLLRAAVAAAVDAPRQARGHARAARLLAERGERVGRIAQHLQSSPPGDGDPWVVATLREAARTTRRQGAPDGAIAPLRRALAEPPDAAARPQVLRELGRAELAALEGDAGEHLRAAHALAREPAERAGLALELGIALYSASRHPEAVDVLRDAIDELEAHPAHREHVLRLEAFLAVAGRYDLATEAQVRGRVQRVAAGLTGATAGERLVLAVAALEAPGTAAADLVRAAARQEQVVGEVPWPDPSEGVGTAMMYLHAGRPDLAVALAERLLARARETGSPVRHAFGLFARAAASMDTGALEEAEADVRAALAVARDVVAPVTGGIALLVLVLAERGALAEADALLTEHALEGPVPERMVLNPLLHARAVLRLAQGRRAEAAADALELGRRHGRWGMTRPSPNWRALAAQALRGDGDAGRAAELAETSLEAARAWDTPKAIATALRARALVRGGTAGLADLEEAQGVLEGTPWRLEAAHVRTDLGAALRREGRRREARVHLEAAMDAAHACGAAGLAARAADELRALGARPRRHAVTGRDALTASERRVAALAAAGATNREVAQELFVTVATVETHLRRAYRKLGIAGRDGLSAALARPGPPA